MSQSQASLFDQLLQLRVLANRHGLYDAADAVQRLIDPIAIKINDESEEPSILKKFDEALSAVIADVAQIAFTEADDASAAVLKIQERLKRDTDPVPPNCVDCDDLGTVTLPDNSKRCISHALKELQDNRDYCPACPYGDCFNPRHQ